ncbi:MAG: hypothetical protein ACFE9S_00045 [Candidatus Hermodarchaeota archaeon]
MERKKKHLLLGVFVLTIIFLNLPFNLYTIINFAQLNGVQVAGEIPGEGQWVKNTDFSSQAYWYMESEGDLTDVDGIISGEQGNFVIIGEHQSFSNITGVPSATAWTPGKESAISILPDVYEFTPYGLNATHEYWEGSGGLNIYGYPRNQSRNNPIVHWNRIVTMPVNMEDYSITSADLSAIFNASADINIETPFESIQGEPTSGYAAEYDHVRFSVYLSDLNKIEMYEVLYNQTIDLGSGYANRDERGGRAIASKINDTLMKIDDEDELIFYLSRVLSHDDQNFRVTLGIDIYNEDNYSNLELDTWYYLLFKTCNLTFDYQKKIDRFTTISWNQDCEKISNISTYPVLVQNATLNFKYKIDNLWNSSLSPNSEIRILINDNKHTETVKLSTATTSFQDAKIGGFDVTNLITDDVNISLQVYLADDFILDQNITVSIDDVSLDISYIIVEPDEPISPGPELGWLVYLLIAVIGGIVIVFGLYQGHFKYPPMVRKIRKLKKKVKKSKKLKPIMVNKRNGIIGNNIQERLEILGFEQIQMKQAQEIDKNTTSETIAKKELINIDTKLQKKGDTDE